MARKIEPSDRDDLIKRYVAGCSENQIANECGVSRTVVTRWLREAGIVRRSQSDAERIKWSFMTDECRRAQVARAHAATKGRVRSDAEVARSAASNFRNQTRKGRGEDAVAAICSGFGIAVEQQYPVGRYNIDVAMHELRVAVEVVGNWPKPGGGTVPYRKRVEHLFDLDWCILWIDATNKRSVDTIAVGKHLLALADAARRNESVAGRQWVIRCDGESATGLGRKLHELTGVPCAQCRNGLALD